jgi:hypothetical protein
MGPGVRRDDGWGLGGTEVWIEVGNRDRDRSPLELELELQLELELGNHAFLQRFPNPKRSKGAGDLPPTPLPKLTSVANYAAWGSAAFTCATIALNAAPSCMAMSARTLRSSSIPASFTPCMNCEYVRPSARTPALMR